MLTGETAVIAIVYPFLALLDYLLYRLACWDAKKSGRKKPPRHIHEYINKPFLMEDQEWYELMIE